VKGFPRHYHDHRHPYYDLRHFLLFILLFCGLVFSNLHHDEQEIDGSGSRRIGRDRSCPDLIVQKSAILV